MGRFAAFKGADCLTFLDDCLAVSGAASSIPLACYGSFRLERA